MNFKFNGASWVYGKNVHMKRELREHISEILIDMNRECALLRSLNKVKGLETDHACALIATINLSAGDPRLIFLAKNIQNLLVQSSSTTRLK